MTRWLITAFIIGTGLMGTIIYMARPEVIDAQAKAAMAPIMQMIDARRVEKFRKAKELAYGRWMATRFTLTPDCVNPHTALKAEECKNKEDQVKIAFERSWQQKVNSGWEPD
jgi:hypothetical protein